MTPVHFSTLKHIGRSPAHYKAALETPFEQTAAMRLGSLVHALVLGGDFCTYDGTRRGKEWEAFKFAHDGELIVTADELSRACKVADALGNHAIAADLLVGQREVGIEWDFLGRKCKSTLDNIGEDEHGHFVTELKTTSNAHPDVFRRAALGRFAYHAQLGFYEYAYNLNGPGGTHETSERAYIVAVETSAPYAITCFQLTRRCINEGKKLCRTWMERLLVCEATDEWPAYSQSIIDLDSNDDVEQLIVDGEVMELQ